MGISQTPQAIVPASLTSGSMTLLSTTTLSGTSTTISGINGTYNDLVAIIHNVQVNTATKFRINPNGDSAYARSVRTYTTSSTQTQIESANDLTTASAAEVCFYFKLSNYASSSTRKPFLFYGNSESGDYAFHQAGLWNRNSVVTSLVFTTANGTSTFSSGTVLLYGVK